jgi:endonuclease/exonuclease/phosphatase family metal-dependent hydrolase
LAEIGTAETASGRQLRGLAVALLVAAFVLCLVPSRVAALEPVQNPGQVGVMTRNLYLGADLTPAIRATSLSNFVDANGHILDTVTKNNFPVRAKGLAEEILDKKPDLVGLQEVALWRTGPTSLAPLQSGPTATNVRYDYLKLLLDELNKGGQLYKPAVIVPEFDFEAPANENGVTGYCPASSGTQTCSAVPNAELNGRLTMRDVILVRGDRDIKVSGEQGGHFDHLLAVNILGRSVTVTRGWTRVDAVVRGGPPFRFVNTHLEAFDDGTLRAQQAQELVASGGPADSKLPVILLGDFNSDDNTVQGKDRLAYQALVKAGFVERSTDNPLSCCIDSELLTEDGGGSVADFDHQVDHITTKAQPKVELIESSVTGRSIQNGFWNSDHAGVFSLLRIPTGEGPNPEAPDSTTTEPPAGSEPGSESPSDSTTTESPTGSESSPEAPSDSTTTASP